MADIVWNGTGLASVGTNWVGGVVPSLADVAVFDGTSVGLCSWDIAGAAAIQGDTGAIDILSGTTLLGALDIGSADPAFGMLVTQESGSVLDITGNARVHQDDTIAQNKWTREAGTLDTIISGSLVVEADAALDFTGDTSTISVQTDIDINSASICEFGLTTVLKISAGNVNNSTNANEFFKYVPGAGSLTTLVGNLQAITVSGSGSGMGTITGAFQLLVSKYEEGDSINIAGASPNDVHVTFLDSAFPVIPAFDYGNARVGQATNVLFEIKGGSGHLKCAELRISRDSQNITTLVDAVDDIDITVTTLEVGDDVPVTGTRGGIFTWGSSGTFICDTLVVRENNAVVSTNFVASAGAGPIVVTTSLELELLSVFDLSNFTSTLAVAGNVTPLGAVDFGGAIVSFTGNVDLSSATAVDYDVSTMQGVSTIFQTMEFAGNPHNVIMQKTAGNFQFLDAWIATGELTLIVEAAINGTFLALGSYGASKLNARPASLAVGASIRMTLQSSNTGVDQFDFAAGDDSGVLQNLIITDVDYTSGEKVANSDTCADGGNTTLSPPAPGINLTPVPKAISAYGYTKFTHGIGLGLGMGLGGGYGPAAPIITTVLLVTNNDGTLVTNNDGTQVTT